NRSNVNLRQLVGFDSPRASQSHFVEPLLVVSMRDNRYTLSRPSPNAAGMVVILSMRIDEISNRFRGIEALDFCKHSQRTLFIGRPFHSHKEIVELYDDGGGILTCNNLKTVPDIPRHDLSRRRQWSVPDSFRDV